MSDMRIENVGDTPHVRISGSQVDPRALFLAVMNASSQMAAKQQPILCETHLLLWKSV